MCRARAASSMSERLRPPTVTLPSSGRRRPVSSEATVDLPQPDSPTTAVKLPAGNSMVTPRSTGRSAS